MNIYSHDTRRNHSIISYRITDNFKKHGTLLDRRHENPGRSQTLAIEENLEVIQRHFEKKTQTILCIRRATRALRMPKSSLWKALKMILKYHAYKISTHQLLTEKKSKERRKLFC